MTWLQVDDSVVHAGWLPLALVGVVALVLVAIYFSMRHHIRIANTFPTEAEVRAERRAAAKKDAAGTTE
jgi:Mg2+/citrate symporter